MSHIHYHTIRRIWWGTWTEFILEAINVINVKGSLKYSWIGITIFASLECQSFWRSMASHACLMPLELVRTFGCGRDNKHLPQNLSVCDFFGTIWIPVFSPTIYSEFRRRIRWKIDERMWTCKGKRKRFLTQLPQLSCSLIKILIHDNWSRKSILRPESLAWSKARVIPASFCQQ